MKKVHKTSVQYFGPGRSELEIHIELP